MNDCYVKPSIALTRICKKCIAKNRLIAKFVVSSEHRLINVLCTCVRLVLYMFSEDM
jgi:hypothetical protein